jgi:hypothetical protein
MVQELLDENDAERKYDLLGGFLAKCLAERYLTFPTKYSNYYLITFFVRGKKNELRLWAYTNGIRYYYSHLSLDPLHFQIDTFKLDERQIYDIVEMIFKKYDRKKMCTIL